MRLHYSILLACAGLVAFAAQAQEGPSQTEGDAFLRIVWPPAEAAIPLGDDPEQAIGVVVESSFRLMPHGACGDDPRCGHVHMKIDPEGDSCNIPGRAYNSMNSDFGGPLVLARFGHCPTPAGEHVIGVLLADDHHRPILVDGKPVTALVRVNTSQVGTPSR